VYDNTRVKSKNSKHHQARQRITIAIMFLKKLDTICNAHMYIKTIKSSIFLNQIENKSELLDWDKRRVYVDQEIDDMLKMADCTKDKLLITVLREIGLRNSAICNLKFKDIIDINRIPKHVCRVKEKGNKIREFVTSDKIKQYIISYIREIEETGILFDEKNKDNMSKYVFSRNKNLNVKMGGSTLNNVLKRIGLKAGVTDVNIQSHTFRHTLVGKLMDAGNNIEVVSKFIGHSSVDTTMNYYWLKNITELANEINNPFTQTMVTEEERREEDNFEIELLNKKIDSCFQIIGFYKNQITEAKNMEELKTSLTDNDIYINKVLKYIADSQAGDSQSMRSRWLNAM
jgi:integrase